MKVTFEQFNNSRHEPDPIRQKRIDCQVRTLYNFYLLDIYEFTTAHNLSPTKSKSFQDISIYDATWKYACRIFR